MKAEVLTDTIHGLAGGQFLRVVRLDPEACKLLSELGNDEEQRATIPDWYKIGQSFEPSKIQTPGAPAGTMFLMIVTPDPGWFVTRLNPQEAQA